MDAAVFSLGAFGFWMFIAAVVVGGMWYDIREKDARHETLRRMAESGQAIDEQLMLRVLGSEKVLHRDLKVAGLIVIFVAPGLAVLGWMISLRSEEWLLPMLGVAALVGFVGFGLLAAAKFAEKSAAEVTEATPKPLSVE